MEPLDRLKMMVAWDIVPTLTEGELAQLLLQNRIPDADGYEPQDAAYTDTYDLNQAAVDGWRLKAGKVSSIFSFSNGVETFNRQQIYDHCIKQVREYQRLVNATLPDIGPPVQRLGWY